MISMQSRCHVQSPLLQQRKKFPFDALIIPINHLCMPSNYRQNSFISSMFNGNVCFWYKTIQRWNLNDK